MQKSHRFTVLTSLFSLLGCGLGFISLLYSLSPECLTTGVAPLIGLVGGLWGISVWQLLTMTSADRPHTTPTPPGDLTDKVQSLSHLLSATHQQLEASEQRFRTSIETMLDCFGVYTAIRDDRGQIIDFRTEFLNDAACLNNQMSLEEQLGRGLCELLPAHRESGLFEQYCQVVETGQPLVKDALFYTDDYGQRRLVRAFDIRAAQLGDGFVVTWRDVTDRHQLEATLRCDITQLKQTEAALKQSEATARARAAELEAFMEAVPAAVWLAHDPQCHHVTPNRAAYQMMRRSPDAVMTATPSNGTYPFQFKIQQHGKDISPEHLPMQQAGRTGQDFSGEFEFVFSEDDVCSLYGKAVPVKNEAGEIQGVIGAFIDITERKQAEIALQQSEERLQLALKGARQGIWDWDLRAERLTWDDRCKEIFGLPANFPVTYASHLQALHPDDRDRVMQAATHAFQSGNEFEEEYRTLWADGTIRWVLARGQCYCDAAGNPYRMSGTVLDITTAKHEEMVRKQAEAALRESELMFRTLADTMPQMFWVTEADGHHQYFNQRWHDYTGIAPDQSPGERWQDIVHPDDLDHTLLIWQASLLTGKTYTNEFRLRSANRDYRWHLGRALPLRDEQERIVKWFGSCTDIHDQKLAIEERAQALERERAARMELERASRMKDEFLAVVSHELRSPLNAILGWARLLRTRTFDPQKTEQALAVIERNAQAQTQLIEDLLDISRIIRGAIRLDLRPTDLMSCIQAAIDTIRPAATTKSITIDVEFDPMLGFVASDPDRLQQIVWNLLSNAVKFTPAGGRVTIELKRVSSFAQIIVRDTGKGIPPDFLPHVFDRFRQADATTTRTQGGLGLGLAIVRNLVELHGWTIQVDSAGEGQGTTFTVQLPLLSASIPQEASYHSYLHRQTLLDTPINLTGIKVLAVDDERDTREFLQTALEQYGATVTSAASAAEAWNFLQTQKPDVVLSDIGMPDEDGYALMRRIRSLPTDQGGLTPAAALTAYAREGDRLQALAAGFQMHIPKPIEPIQLLTVIMKLTGRQPGSLQRDLPK